MIEYLLTIVLFLLVPSIIMCLMAFRALEQAVRIRKDITEFRQQLITLVNNRRRRW